MKLERLRHYLTRFELHTSKKVTPAMAGMSPGGTQLGWVVSAGQVQPENMGCAGSCLVPTRCQSGESRLPFSPLPSPCPWLRALGVHVVSDQLEGAMGGLYCLDNGTGMGIAWPH